MNATERKLRDIHTDVWLLGSMTICLVSDTAWIQWCFVSIAAVLVVTKFVRDFREGEFSWGKR